jgi:hypothetical protein
VDVFFVLVEVLSMGKSGEMRGRGGGGGGRKGTNRRERRRIIIIRREGRKTGRC